MIYVDEYAMNTAKSDDATCDQAMTDLLESIVRGDLAAHGIAGGERAVFVGGAALDRWKVRSTDPTKYPSALFEGITFLVAYGPTSPAGGAYLEEHLTEVADAVPQAAVANTRRSVSEYEHRTACDTRTASVYMRLVKQEVGVNKFDFKNKWDAYCHANPETYTHTLQASGTDAYSQGTDAFSQGTDAYSQGTDAFSQGTNAYS